MIVHSAPQGSEEWLASRRGVITASRFKDCRDKLKNGQPSRACALYAKDVARERVGGKAPDKFQNGAMRAGVEQEPLARLAYEAATGSLVEEVGFITTDDGYFGVSVDGLVDADGVVEIKTLVSSDTLFTVLSGDISEYVDQCNGALWLLGRKWVDLVLWAPDLECIGKHLTIMRIERDAAAIDSLESDLIDFMLTVNAHEAALRAPAGPVPTLAALLTASIEQCRKAA